MNTCATCRFWDKSDVPREGGVCGAVAPWPEPFVHPASAVVEVPFDYDAAAPPFLRTHPLFGCVQWLPVLPPNEVPDDSGGYLWTPKDAPPDE